MSVVNVFFGEKHFDLILKLNEDVTDFEFLVLDSNLAPLDLVGTEHKISVYDKQGGLLIYTGNFVQLINSLKWTFKYAELGLPLGNFYHEMSYIDSNIDFKIIGFGLFTMI